MSLPKTVCSVWQTVVVRASIILFFGTFRARSVSARIYGRKYTQDPVGQFVPVPALTIAVAEPKRSCQFSVWPREPDAGDGIPLSERGLVAPGLAACAMAGLGLAQSSEATSRAELRSGVFVALRRTVRWSQWRCMPCFRRGRVPRQRPAPSRTTSPLSGASFLTV
jgi:hypothetical protein